MMWTFIVRTSNQMSVGSRGGTIHFITNKSNVNSCVMKGGSGRMQMSTTPTNGNPITERFRSAKESVQEWTGLQRLKAANVTQNLQEKAKAKLSPSSSSSWKNLSSKIQQQTQIAAETAKKSNIMESTKNMLHQSTSKITNQVQQSTSQLGKNMASKFSQQQLASKLRRYSASFMKGISSTSTKSKGHSPPRIKLDGDFKDLVTQSTVFADKSLFIKDVIEDDSTSILIAMPRRWGKTVNMDMLKRFLEIPVDADGKVMDKSKTDNHKLFSSGQVDGGMRGYVQLKSLNIATARFFQNVDALCIQGTRPVISIDFKNCKAANYEGVLAAIKTELRKCFSFHGFLEESAKLQEEEKQLIKRHTGAISSKELSENEVKSGLCFLSEMLYKHHNSQKVWILVDEYDAVANVAYRDFSDIEHQKTIDLFSGIYEQAFKSNPYLEKGVLTGVQYIEKSGMLSGLNNLGKFDFTNAKYAQHYGLDQDEVDLFFSHFQVPLDLAAKAKQWYNGYKAPRYLSSKSTIQQPEIVGKYNIWSIVNFLKEGRDNGYSARFKSYWEKSGSIDFLNKLFKKKEVRANIEHLVNGESIYLDRIADFSASDFKTLKALLSGNKEVNDNGLDVLFSYLFIGGYLTIDESKADHYHLPNREITYEMGRRLITYYQTIYTIDPVKIQAVTDVLQKVMDIGESSQNSLSALLQDFYGNFRSVIQSIHLVNNESEEGVFANEDIIHSMLNYIALQTQHTTMGSELYTEKINTQEKGRADLKIIKGDVGMILEVKCVPTNKGSNKHMEEALNQSKKYSSLLETNNQLFMAINVAKKASKPEERSIELLCSNGVSKEAPTIAINASGELFDSNN